MLTFLANQNAFSQNKSLATEEDKLAKLYSKMLSFTHVSYDSIEGYSNKFEKEFTRFIQNNPGTLKYPFEKFSDSSICAVETSSDGNFRIYTWDTWVGGTQHFYKAIYQWKANGKVFTKVPAIEDGDGGEDCSAMYTVTINNKPYYLAVMNSIGSTMYGGQSVSAFTIDGNKLNDTVKLFKTRTAKLNRIHIGFEFASIEDQRELIVYDSKLKIVYIPLVDEHQKVTKKNLLYQLKGHYFIYIGVETGWRRTSNAIDMK
ncbi:hypothetical protein [Niastella sp. OAS944]|uniref:hypothetical protein n=1 Tax=Niastella sp. OAS944 TaxID=2664089 RepID=UPI0035C7FC9E|nr:hypothetical protein [Chitinophagaceae bacterium OAS944]